MSKNLSRTFDRRISANLLLLLQNDTLFRDYLLPDIIRSPGEKGSGVARVFPAVREERVDFYHRGGKLFSFDKYGFRTNLKYAASIANADILKPEIQEADLKHIVRISDFKNGYKNIKSLCALYSGEEAKGVSALYGRYPFATYEGRHVVLDIEASFDARVRDDGTDDAQDRIDIVLLDIEKAELLFVEAKCYVNPAIIAAEGSIPPVVAQIRRYKAQLSAQKTDVVEAYGRYVRAMNCLFKVNLPEPVSVSPDVPLLIFGYDGQQEARANRCKRELGRHGVTCISIGKLPPKDGATLAKWFARVNG
jgi:hypothetical protein